MFVLAVLGLGLNAMCLVGVLLSPTDVVVQSTDPDDELSRMDVLPAVLASKLVPGGLHLLAVGLCAMVAVGARRPERQSDRRLRTAFALALASVVVGVVSLGPFPVV